ncbi:unnamed protein product [Polarella glacialis]|uniref:Ubiquitin-like domain-containing protein n=1 Tax=Polarella glacialis TaxID=89957 RepID=A0A813DG41_POLGL|nr:unnamed protein product [Polarella glacialis]CAE8737109.1 unnamed protein product [Polarella glacialis]
MADSYAAAEGMLLNVAQVAFLTTLLSEGSWTQLILLGNDSTAASCGSEPRQDKDTEGAVVAIGGSASTGRDKGVGKGKGPPPPLPGTGPRPSGGPHPASGSTDRGPSLQIVAQMMDGRELQLELFASAFVQQLADEVGDLLGISQHRVRLTFGAAILQQKDTLASCGIADGDAVSVVVLPPIYGRLAEAKFSQHVKVPESVISAKLELHDALEAAGRLQARNS